MSDATGTKHTQFSSAALEEIASVLEQKPIVDLRLKEALDITGVVNEIITTQANLYSLTDAVNTPNARILISTHAMINILCWQIKTLKDEFQHKI